MLALSGSNVIALSCSLFSGDLRVPQVNEVRGRPRKQLVLPAETTDSRIGDESPVEDPIQKVPQLYIPSSSCGHVAPTMQTASNAQDTSTRRLAEL